MPADEQSAPKPARIEANVTWAAGTAFYLEALRDACYEARAVCESVERRAGYVLLSIAVTLVMAASLVAAVGLFGGLTPTARIVPMGCAVLATLALAFAAWAGLHALDERGARWMRLDRLVAEKTAALASQQAQQRFIEALRLQVDFNAKIMDQKSDALQRAGTGFRVAIALLLLGYIVAAAEFTVPGGVADRAARWMEGRKGHTATAALEWIDSDSSQDPAFEVSDLP